MTARSVELLGPARGPAARPVAVLVALVPLLLVAVVAAVGVVAVADGARPAGATPGAGGRGATAGPPRYRPPLDAPVVDPFRPPAEPWLAGNRGLEYQTVPGTPVGAIGPGLVVFAGPVAGQLHVTVLHPDGIRSSYSYLASIAVAVGDRVRTGDVVGTTAERFHLGARIGDTYIDPASLFGRLVGRASVYLVPAQRGTAGAVPPGPDRPRGRSTPGPLAAGVRAGSGPVRDAVTAAAARASPAGGP